MNSTSSNVVEKTRKAVVAWAGRVKQAWAEGKTPRERLRRLWADKTNRVVAVVAGLLLLGVISSGSGGDYNGYPGAGGHVNPMGSWSESYSNGRVTHSEYSGVTVYSEN